GLLYLGGQSAEKREQHAGVGRGVGELLGRQRPGPVGFLLCLVDLAPQVTLAAGRQANLVSSAGGQELGQQLGTLDGLLRDEAELEEEVQVELGVVGDQGVLGESLQKRG